MLLTEGNPLSSPRVSYSAGAEGQLTRLICPIFLICFRPPRYHSRSLYERQPAPSKCVPNLAFCERSASVELHSRARAIAAIVKAGRSKRVLSRCWAWRTYSMGWQFVRLRGRTIPGSSEGRATAFRQSCTLMTLTLHFCLGWSFTVSF